RAARRVHRRHRSGRSGHENRPRPRRDRRRRRRRRAPGHCDRDPRQGGGARPPGQDAGRSARGEADERVRRARPPARADGGPVRRPAVRGNQGHAVRSTQTRITAAGVVVAVALSLAAAAVRAQGKPRARDLGIPFDGTPGPANAITDVAGVEVGATTLISGEGALKVGSGPVRTGVTAILPRGKSSKDQVFAGWFSLNGNGEMTGTTWIEE